MPFVVEYQMTRPNKEIEFPTASEEQEELSKLREEYSVSTEVFFSEDELTRTLRHTTSSVQEYSSFYEKAQPLWEKVKISDQCVSLDIALTMDVIENT